MYQINVSFAVLFPFLFITMPMLILRREKKEGKRKILKLDGGLLQ